MAGISGIARKNADSAYTEMFRMRTQELGGFNPRTSAQIRREAQEAGRHAFAATYFDAGYVACGCGSLVSPQFARCYVCGAWKKSGTMSKAEASFISALEAVSKGVVFTALPE